MNIPIKKFDPLVDAIQFPKGYSLQETGTSQSLLQNYLNCKVKYKLGLNKYEKVDGKNNTGFGSMTHDVLDKMYTYYKMTGCTPSDGMIDYWIELFPKKFPDDLYNMDQQTIERCMGINYVLLTEYVRYYPEDFKKKKFIEVEVVSEIKWHGFLLRRKTDAMYRSINNKKWILEHKTKSQISEKNLLQILAIDFQNLFYLTAEELRDLTEEVAGILYNVIRNPLKEQKKNETLNQFLDRLREDVRARPDHYFKRFEVPYPTRTKKQFKVELLHLLNEVDKTIKGELPCYKNITSCLQPWPCEFLGACSCGRLVGYKQRKYWFPELHIGK